MDTLKYILGKFKLDKYLDEYGKPQVPDAFNANTPDGISYKPLREARLPDFTREDLTVLLAELGFNIGAEIGVERGLYSESLLRVNPRLCLYLVDPLKVYSGYREHVTQEKMDGFFDEIHARLNPYRSHFRGFALDRRFSLDAVQSFKDGFLDFVYIDGNHDFQNTTNDIVEWSKKVRKGGIIAGHDYNRNKKKDYRCHVKDVVQAYTYAYDIHPYFVTSDKSPSWFFVKE